MKKEKEKESKKHERSEMKYMRKGGAPASMIASEKKEMKSGGMVKKRKGC